MNRFKSRSGPHLLTGLIWVQIVWKDYRQLTPAGKELNQSDMHWQSVHLETMKYVSSEKNGMLFCYSNTGPEVIKLFPCLTQLSTKFILLINVKMPTIVGILTFISMIKTASERLKARKIFICWYFSCYVQFKFHALLSWAWKKFNNLGASSATTIYPSR